MKRTTVIMILLLVSIAGCSKKETGTETKSDDTYEIVIPTLEPSEEPTVSPEETTQEQTTIQPQETGESEEEESVTASPDSDIMESMISVNLSDSYDIVYDEENMIATIQSDGIKVATLKLINEETKSTEIEAQIEEISGIDGYIESLRTVEMTDYTIYRAVLNTSVSEDEESTGMLVTGEETLQYYYVNKENSDTIFQLAFASQIDNEEADQIADGIGQDAEE